MKKHRLALFGLFAGLSALAVSSCAYDPYYSGTSYSGSYGSGYGYGGSNFSTSFFVSTGNPRWAYDPYAACYYDYTRRAYYDPYLYGYYPVGYRPRYVVGAPHPHGWYRGRNYCPPPTVIRNRTIDNYSNRAQSYRSLGRDWSRNVSVSAPTNQPRPGYGGRDSHDRNYDSSRGSGAPQRTDRVPSRGGSIQRGEIDRTPSGRGQSGRSGANRQDPRQTVSQPGFPMNRGEDRRGGSAGGSPERQPRQQIERPSAPPQPRMQRPAPRESSPANSERGGRSRSESPGPGGESPGRGRGGIRSLGDG
jgi:hypothetical protein